MSLTGSGDLASLLWDVFRGNGRQVNGPRGPVTLIRSANGGDFGDAVVLAHSVNEYASSFGGQPPRARLPALLRSELEARGGRVFNPRGQALRDIPDVQQMVGALLESLDPGGAIQSGMRLTAPVQRYFAAFRAAYTQYAQAAPDPNQPHGLRDFVEAWGQRRSQGPDRWPREWPILELCFTLLAWFPRLRDDPEGQVHLETISRAIAQSATFSPYRALILTGPAPHDRRCVESALRDIFAPLADSAVEVDEEIVPSIPRDRLTIMTIHQAKGLEYPLVIADVSSDFSRNHPKNRFRRFPDLPSNVASMEDDLAPASEVGPLRQQRTALDRTFDDLVRLYYVCYSRPQSVLLLVGLDKCLQYATTIKNVATFWRTNGTWPWVGPFAGNRPPPMANSIPLELL
ncbi:MAG TPA: 3'-5' exonuclease [Fimbriimonas sp.]|nr:3'-5' exonuclease [Fimbriimonas sp.]